MTKLDIEKAVVRQEASEKELGRRRGVQVLSPEDVGDARVRVVHDGEPLIRGKVVAAPDDEVAEFIVDVHRAPIHVDHGVGRDGNTQSGFARDKLMIGLSAPGWAATGRDSLGELG